MELFLAGMVTVVLLDYTVSKLFPKAKRLW
jgi:hypothetical protein